MELTFRSLAERGPGAAWRRAFDAAWPGWRRWYLSRGGAARLADGERQLRRHMPELVPVWQRQLAAVDGDELAARFLTFWNPPAYLVHCSQAVLIDAGGPLLVRNYDLDPRLNEATVLRSAWSGHPVLATMEGIAGAADGVNAAGLAVSLTFGGREVVGEGFGVPLIVRYLLETCRSVREAVAALRRIPTHMSYNLTLVDPASEIVTAFIAPDRPPEFLSRPYATNHQRRVEMHERARFSNTIGREKVLARLLGWEGLTADELVAAFLAPPLYASRHALGFGTVYTAAYRPEQASVAMHWPGQEPWRLACERFEEGLVQVRYGRRVELPEGFGKALEDCLRRPHAADWAGLGRFWAGAFPQFAG
ncbi:MAG: C45 family autoproteolytic acyltransferase/hydrolase [Geminicoccaceae bacterium]